MRLASKVELPLFAVIALLFCVGPMNFGCESTEEAIDNFDSHIACGDYCDKKFGCDDQNPTGDENDACVSACRDSIEDNCGNEHQAAANDQIGTCVDKGCADFWACMTFEAYPSCYGFVN